MKKLLFLLLLTTSLSYSQTTPIPTGSMARGSQYYQKGDSIYVNLGAGGTIRLSVYQDIQYRTVANITQRNAIPGWARKQGMLVWVVDQGKHYILVGSVWNDFGLGYTPYNPASYPVQSGGETLQSVMDRGHETTKTLKVYNTVNDSQIYLTAEAGSFGQIQAVNATNTGVKNLVLQSIGGNVGIGTTTPTEKLHVAGTGLFKTPGELGLYLSAVSTGYVIQGENAAGTSGANLILNPTVGNVGIYNSNPSEKLEVNGNVKINGNIIASNFSSGTYTPTATDLSNIVSVTPAVCQYTRIGNIVTVHGNMLVNTNYINTLASLFLSLPITSDLTVSSDLNGQGNVDSEELVIRTIDARVDQNKARFVFSTNIDTSGNYRVFFSFMYEVK